MEMMRPSHDLGENLDRKLRDEGLDLFAKH